jgi:hypothetical protein
MPLWQELAFVGAFLLLMIVLPRFVANLAWVRLVARRRGLPPRRLIALSPLIGGALVGLVLAIAAVIVMVSRH